MCVAKSCKKSVLKNTAILFSKTFIKVKLMQRYSTLYIVTVNQAIWLEVVHVHAIYYITEPLCQLPNLTNGTYPNATSAQYYRLGTVLRFICIPEYFAMPDSAHITCQNKHQWNASPKCNGNRFYGQLYLKFSICIFFRIVLLW